MMNLKIPKQFLLTIFGLFITQLTFAQLEKGKLVDGISVVVGNEIVLESDIQEQMEYAKQQGAQITDKCQFVEGIISNKVLLYEAKRDTLIENRSNEIRNAVDQKYSQILGQFPDEKTMLEYYKIASRYEMKNIIEKTDTDSYYSQQKYGLVTMNADVTPNQVSDFYTTNEFQFPEVKDEVTLAQIVQYPILTDQHKQELIDRLKKIKADILSGESFESQARIYSEDPGSAAKGGGYTNINRGQMAKGFEASALNLQVGEISDPIETEFGYHIIRLDRKAGKIYDASHILLLSTPTEQEISTAKAKLDSIRNLIINEKISFKDAAFKFSDDKSTKFNAGIIQAQNESDRLEKASVSPNVAFQIAGVNPGDITEAFEDELNNRKVVKMVKLVAEYPTHKLTLESDYDRIKSMALNKKRNDMLDKYVEERLPHIFISIDDRYLDCGFKQKWKK